MTRKTTRNWSTLCSCRRPRISSKMNAFRKNYKVYYFLMHLLGLWPYDHSIRTRIKRTFFSALMVSCVINQMLTLRNIKPTLYDVVVLLSNACPLMMYCLRYITSIFTFSVLKYLLDNLQHDYDTLNDPLEVQMLMKESIVVKRIVVVYIALTSTGSLLVFGLLMVPTLMQSDAQLRCLRLIGYFYNERNLHTSLTCLHMFLTTVYGLLTFVCTETTLTITSTYASGLLHIASYRINNAVTEIVSSDRTKPLNIGPAVQMHRQAIKQIANYVEGLMMTSLTLVLLAVVSFGVNIYRLFVDITVVKETDNTIFSMQVVLAHLAIIFGSNYSGQIVIDNSAKILHATYDTLWYRLPPKMQKLVLFVMMKAQTQLEVNLSGLFTPCFEGFSMMMSTSFSYFTLLCSVH